MKRAARRHLLQQQGSPPPLMDTDTTDQGAVRIGKRDPQRGTYNVHRANGSIAAIGDRIFSASFPEGQHPVRPTPLPNGKLALDQRSHVAIKPKPVEEKPVLPLKILFAMQNKDGIWQFYIGGDRPTPELVYENPKGYVIKNIINSGYIKGYLENLGSRKDDWVGGLRINYEEHGCPQVAISLKPGVVREVDTSKLIPPDYKDHNGRRSWLWNFGYMGRGGWFAGAKNYDRIHISHEYFANTATPIQVYNDVGRPTEVANVYTLRPSMPPTMVRLPDWNLNFDYTAPTVAIAWGINWERDADRERGVNWERIENGLVTWSGLRSSTYLDSASGLIPLSQNIALNQDYNYDPFHPRGWFVSPRQPFWDSKTNDFYYFVHNIARFGVVEVYKNANYAFDLVNHFVFRENYSFVDGIVYTPAYAYTPYRHYVLNTAIKFGSGLDKIEILKSDGISHPRIKHKIVQYYKIPPGSAVLYASYYPL